MEKFLETDWLRAVQILVNSAKMRKNYAKELKKIFSGNEKMIS